MPKHVTYLIDDSCCLIPETLLYKPMSWNLKIRAELAVLHNLNACPKWKISVKEDITTLKSKFLIEHIEQIFKQRDKYGWVKSIPFNDFCEYLLPYRIKNEDPILWRDSIIDGMNEFKNYIQFDNICSSINFMSAHLLSVLQSPLLEFSHTLPKFFHNYAPDCRDYAYDNVIRYRMLGIPAAIDEVPCWGNSNGNHVWAQPIDHRERITTSLSIFNRLVPKVYRNTYSDHSKLGEETEYIPKYFRNPFLIDVTSEYLYCVPKVKENGFGNSSYGYLCVSRGEEWTPIAQAENRAGECIFPNMGPDIVYLPVYYKDGNMICANDPFLLNRDGSKVYFHALDKREDITVYRKYPVEDIHERLMKYFTGIIEASEFCDFHKSDTICHFSNIQSIMAPIEKSFSMDKYHFIRISSLKHPIHMAELCIQNIKGKRVYAMPMQQIPKVSLMQDNDVLTYGEIQPSLSFMLPKDEKVASICLLPRNDGNGIYPGDKYELLYFDRERKWVSLECKVANSYRLKFKQIPDGALLLLRNLSRGKQVRIFTYTNGKQSFK